MGYRLITVVFSLLVIVGISVSWAQVPATEPAAKALDPEIIAVRLILGIGDATPRNWSGRVALDKGEIVDVEGLRFRDGDMVTGRDSWKTSSRLIRKAAAKKAAAKAKQAAAKAKRQAATEAQGQAAAQEKRQDAPKAATGPSTTGPTVTPNGVVIALKNVAGAALTVETEQGKFTVSVDRLADGRAVSLLDDRVNVQRVFPHAPLFEGAKQQDFPAAASDSQGAGAWITAVWHEPRGPELMPAVNEQPKDFAECVPTGGGDQVRLLHFQNGKAGEPLDVTEPARDIWRPGIVTAGDGSVVVVWTEKRDENWDLFGRRYEPKTNSFSPELRITAEPGADSDAVLATAANGMVWLAWQSWTGGQADILLVPLDASGKPGAPPQKISDTPANEWAPSIATDSSGRVHVAFDSYQAGNYDVLLRTRETDGTLSPAITVAGTAKYEARPSVAADPRGRAWVAYEERTPNWGKDAVNLLDGKGSSLYRQSKVVVAVVDGVRVLLAPDPVEHAPDSLKNMNSYPRLTVDRAGRPWLAFRHRQEAIWGNNAVIVTGAVWTSQATSLSGPAWSVPQPLTRGDGSLDSRPALVHPPAGPVLAFYSSDGRLRREAEMNPQASLKYFSNQGTPPGVFNVDLEVSALAATTPFAEPRLSAAPVLAAEPAANVHPGESADLARIRAYRIDAGGTNYRLLRGEFHRHTEISADGGSDGSLEDMWRYALDAASLDWIGNGDHDNGGGKEYTWWLIQKTTDLYTQPPKFVPMFTYERSVAYPHGHRNVMFDHRGVRTLPRLVGETGVVDADTLMLYDYLKEHNGICASHTSATGMGTDWRDVNPVYEPFVEVYQGHRQSYEYLGAPRSARRKGESIGGWQPLGMVWNALAMQYKLGFQASSDHISTHISYAIALAEDTTRPAILDAFRRRHCYAATDNIIMDVRSGEHLMGDEFDANGPVKLKVFVRGTAVVARVDIIKDFRYVYTTEPKNEQVEFEWTDDEQGRPAGLSWYYARALQVDGELAWASPIWVHSR
jgi:hypothetical protein